MDAANKLISCLACGGSLLSPSLDFGMQPLANSYIPDAPRFPLQVNFCTECTHCQLSIGVHPEVLFKNYKYVSGTTDTLKNHFADLATLLLVHPYGLQYDFPILDIGCNDGSLMHELSEMGFQVEGVDPAENLREITKEKGFIVHTRFWNMQTAEELIAKECKKYSVITALNCLAHNANPLEFLLACKKVLVPEGVIIVEFPLFPSTLKKLDLGQIYHEHHSYFSVRSFLKLVERAGMQIEEIEEFPEIHGGTFRFWLKIGRMRCGNDSRYERVMQKIETPYLVAQLLSAFRQSLKRQLSELSQRLHGYFNGGRKIIVYGASAKSATLFNHPEFTAKNCLAYIVDDNPLKWDTVSPGTNIRICSPESLKLEEPENTIVLLTVHNFRDEIVTKLKQSGVRYVLHYVPSIELEDLHE